MTTTQCPCCQTQQRHLYCSSCLQQGIATHHDAAVSYRKQTSAAITRAKAILSPSGPSQRRGLDEWRTLRAEVARGEKRCAQLRADIERRKLEITQASQRLQTMRQTTDTRRQNLDAASSSRTPQSAISDAKSKTAAMQQQVARRLVEARQVLVREIVAIFGVKQRLSGDWEIAGMVLPSPDLFRLHSHSNINAAIVHTAHLLSLITKYLTIALPFTPTPPSPLELPHIGKPYMKANLPFVGTKKWRERPILWMSHSASVAKLRSQESALSTSRFLPTSQTLASAISRSSYKHRQFLIAYALLAHSVSYLAWTQGVQGIGFKDDEEAKESDDDEDDTPFRSRPQSRLHQRLTSSTVLHSPTSVLELIHALANSPMLGERSHEPGTTQARGLGFDLDVAKVVASVLGAEDLRWGTKKDSEEIGEDWDLVEGDRR